MVAVKRGSTVYWAWCTTTNLDCCHICSRCSWNLPKLWNK